MSNAAEPATTTLTLTDFLLARIADDEAMAQEALGRASVYGAREVRWHWLRSAGSSTMWEPTDHDPTRVLAECEAKRQIVQMLDNVLQSFSAQNGGPGRLMWNDVNRRERHHANETLYRLALPYADHPDYRDEWRP